MKRIATAWLAALGFLLLVATLPTYAQPAGRDYVTIDPPLNSDSPGKIEVIEFFSFACPHCNDLQPLLNTWETKLPRDVVFKRVPVVFNPFYQLMAKLYYALDITGDLARLDGAVFNAIHAKGLRLVDEKSITNGSPRRGSTRGSSATPGTLSHSTPRSRAVTSLPSPLASMACPPSWSTDAIWSTVEIRKTCWP